MTQAQDTSTASNFLLQIRMAKHLWVWSFSIVLLFGLIVSQSASYFPTADHHSVTSGEESDSPAKSTTVSGSCHPALSCVALVIPAGAATQFVSNFASVSQLDSVQTQPRFNGPSVSLPPPRPLI